MIFDLKDIEQITEFGNRYYVSTKERNFIFLLDDHCAVEVTKEMKIFPGDTEDEAEWLQNLEWYVQKICGTIARCHIVISTIRLP